MQPLFITGIGTGVGKTIVSAIVTEALQANYWKPIQAGFEDGTDALQVASLISNSQTIIQPEVYKLVLPASPHIAAKQEGISINLNHIKEQLPNTFGKPLIIEGAGGIMVPLNEQAFVIDLIKQLNAKVILVSRNYLGSINHSLLTAMACKQYGIDVLGWIFNDPFMNYEDEIVQWSGYPKIASIPLAETLDRHFVQQQAEQVRLFLQHWL
jgi:dethiobiotin synthetase